MRIVLSVLAVVVSVSAVACGDKSLGTTTPTSQPFSDPLWTMVVSPASVTMPVGDSVQLHTTVNTKVGLAVTDSIIWATPDTAVAEVSATGVVRARAKGSAVIIATDARIPAAQGAAEVVVNTK